MNVTEPSPGVQHPRAENALPPEVQSLPVPYRLLFGALLCIAVGVAALAAWYAVFFSVRIYDDEGYVLITLRDVLRGGALYDQVYSQYGPAYYAVQGATLRIVGQTVTHDVLRIVTLVHWLLASVLAGAAVWRISRSAVAGAAAFLGTYAFLRVCGWEPAHPQSLTSLCLVGAIFAATWVGPGRAGKVAAFALGLLAAVLLLIKINLGVFLLVAAGLAGFRTAGTSAFARFGFWASAAAALALPLVLMRSLLFSASEGWVAVFCALVMVSVGMVVFTAYRSEPVRAWDRTLTLWATAGFFTAAPALVAWTLTRGTTVSGLLYGVLLQHLGLDTIFVVPANVTAGHLLTFALPGGVAWLLSYTLSTMRRGGGATAAGTVLVVAKLWFGLATLGIILLHTAKNIDVPPLPMIVSVWLGAVTLPALAVDPPSLRFGRLLLTAAAAIMALAAYPVAGGQLSSALVLPVCVAALCLGDGVRAIAARLPVGAGVRFHALAGFVVASAAVAYVSVTCAAQRAAYLAADPFDLPGSRRIRVEKKHLPDLRALTAELANNSDTFFSYPGLNSLYFWTGKESPTRLNAGTWMTLLTDEQQRRVIQDLSVHDGLVLVYNAEIEYFWLRSGVDVSGKPLVAYLRQEFVPYTRIGGYMLARRRAPAGSP